MSVPNLWDKLPEAPPASELNPLTNPLLERNLRRWANVYFGNPPARRQQAVSKLIEELQREAAAPASEASPSARVREAKFLGVICSACQHQNPPGHKFCSRCGETLDPAASPLTEQLAGPPDPEPRSVRPANDVQWMPEQRFSSLDKFDSPPRRGWKYLAAAAVIVMAGVAYLQWFSGTKTRMASTHPTATPRISEPASPALNNSPSADTSRPPEPISPPALDTAQNKTATPPLPDQTAAPTLLQPAIQRSPLPDAEKSHPAAPIEESGASDLRQAQRYLEGGMGKRDSTAAAKLLWQAVKKQNAAAEVLLSDLYLRGDGVPQSCDQARLLLLAAAKRGSSQGAQQLRDLESGGCR